MNQSAENIVQIKLVELEIWLTVSPMWSVCVLNQSSYRLDIGFSMSWPHANSLYPFQACWNACFIAICSADSLPLPLQLLLFLAPWFSYFAPSCAWFWSRKDTLKFYGPRLWEINQCSTIPLMDSSKGFWLISSSFGIWYWSFSDFMKSFSVSSFSSAA